MQSYDYLILGNSAAAVSAIEAIRSMDAKGTIAVVSPEDFPAYSTPMISYLVKGKVDEGKMPVRSASFYEDNTVKTILGNAAVAIDPAAHEVELSDMGAGSAATNGGGAAADDDADADSENRIGYGKLLVATGSVPQDPPVEGLEGENVFTFLNLTDARNVLAYIAKLRAEAPDAPVRVAVIGSGLIGCKACEGLAVAADEVTMLARSPLILRSIIDENASRIAERALAEAGVDVRLSTQAVAFEKAGDRVASLKLNDGSVLDTDIVMLAAGVKPNAAMLAAAGAKVERGVVCDEHMQTTIEDVYAAGDVAQSHDVLENRERVIALWPNAVDQGRVAGLAMAGAACPSGAGAACATNASANRTPDATSPAAKFEGSFPMNSIPLCGITICTAGVKDAGESMEQTIETDGDVYAKLVTRDGKLVGFTLVNRPENAGIYTRLIREQTDLSTVDPSIMENVPRLIDLPAESRWTLADSAAVVACGTDTGSDSEGGAR